MTPELKNEMKQWDQASDEAWAIIDQWESDEKKNSSEPGQTTRSGE